MAYVPPSDWELKDFIRDHAEAVYRGCGFLTVGRMDALSTTREIFRRLLSQGMEFRSERDARAWMILNAYKMSRKAPRDAAAAPQGQELLKLRRKDRLVALLYYCEGYRKKEIADYLGCTEASVRRRLSRVKRKLAVEEQEEAMPEEEETPEEIAEVIPQEAEAGQETEAETPEAAAEEAPEAEVPEAAEEEAPEAAEEDASEEIERPEPAPEETAQEAAPVSEETQTGGEAEC